VGPFIVSNFVLYILHYWISEISCIFRAICYADWTQLPQVPPWNMLHSCPQNRSSLSLTLRETHMETFLLWRSSGSPRSPPTRRAAGAFVNSRPSMSRAPLSGPFWICVNMRRQRGSSWRIRSRAMAQPWTGSEIRETWSSTACFAFQTRTSRWNPYLLILRTAIIMIMIIIITPEKLSQLHSTSTAFAG